MPDPWWKASVIYQVYPRSFCNSNGDGIGDLPGILTRLDYLKHLGIDVIWLSPVYRSPNADNGYDISDYQDIMPEFGTLADWEELLGEIHSRGMKLVMDLVVNHTSDQHSWFQQARLSKDNPYRDYYIWRQGRDGREPNNWAAHFGGSAWTLDPLSGEYYLHLFTPQQPDLNWENPVVRQEIYTMMRWWLDKGIDGFRMDVINMLSKVEGLPDAPVLDERPYQYAGKHFINGPRLFEYLEEMKREVLSRYDVMTVGETPDVNTRDGIRFTHPQTGVMSMLFQFEHMHLDKRPDDPSSRRSIQPWRLSDLKRVMSRWQNDLYETGLEQPVPGKPRPAALGLAFRGRWEISNRICEAAGDLLLHAAGYALHLPGAGAGHDQREVRSRSTSTATSSRSTCTMSWWRKWASRNSRHWLSCTPRAGTTPARRCSGIIPYMQALALASRGSRSIPTTPKSTPSGLSRTRIRSFTRTSG